MRRFKIILLVVALTGLGMMVLPTKALAQASGVNDFTVTDFNGDYSLSKKDPQGSLDITERISVDFTGQNHGILRALPKSYNGQPQHIHIKAVDINGNAEQYTTYSQNGNLVLKIGDPNNTLTGAQNYEIDYSVENVIRFVDGHNELDWNINGDQWAQPFNNVTATLHLPLAVADEMHTNPQCFTGAYGSTASDCTVTQTANHTLTTLVTNHALQPGTTLTMRADFNPGTFAAATFKDWLHDHWPVLVGTLLPLLLALAVAGGYWRRVGKDQKGRGTIIPEYGPPDNLKPAQVDVVAHYKLSTKGISATIIDLAIRRYIKIIETEKKGLLGLGGGKDYQVQLLYADVSALSDYEQQILAGLFGGGAAVGVTVSIANLKTFYLTSQALQKLLPAQLTTLGYFSKNPTKSGNVLHFVGGLLIFGSFALHSVLSIGLVLAGVVCLLFAFIMPKRSAKGVAAEEAIKGLRLYMDVAEKDRIKMLQSPDAPYAEKAEGPAKTVELFEKLLPYAMVLGVEQQWAKKFESIYSQPPNWYAGNWSTFNAVYLASSLTSSMGAMEHSFAPPRSSGSGMGGGFAGGGGGGGGGGGW